MTTSKYNLKYYINYQNFLHPKII